MIVEQLSSWTCHHNTSRQSRLFTTESLTTNNFSSQNRSPTNCHHTKFNVMGDVLVIHWWWHTSVVFSREWWQMSLTLTPWDFTSQPTRSETSKQKKLIGSSTQHACVKVRSLDGCLTIFFGQFSLVTSSNAQFVITRWRLCETVIFLSNRLSKAHKSGSWFRKTLFHFYVVTFSTCCYLFTPESTRVCLQFSTICHLSNWLRRRRLIISRFCFIDTVRSKALPGLTPEYRKFDLPKRDLC